MTSTTAATAIASTTITFVSTMAVSTLVLTTGVRKAALGLLLLLAAPSQAPASFSTLAATLSGPANGGQFGQSVSISGDGTRLAIGAHLVNSQGQVSVYAFSGNSWNALGAALSGESNGDMFGYKVALSYDGTRLVVSAPKGDGAGGVNTGHIRVYEYDGSSWVQFGDDIDGTEVDALFGWKLAIQRNGRRVVVGNYAHDGGLAESGLVTVFEVDTTGVSPKWEQTGNANGGGSTQMARGYFGSSVAITEDGTRIAAGALHTNSYRGSVRMLHQPVSPSSDWTEVGDIMFGTGTGGGSNGVRCGFETALSADGTVMTSSCSYGASKYGQVRVYEYAGGVWSQRGDFIDGDGYLDFAIYHSLSDGGELMLIGSPLYGSDNAGKARLFQYDSATGWTNIADTVAQTASGQFGTSVSMSGDGTVLVVGAPGIGSLPGQVYTYASGVVDSSSCRTLPPPPPEPPVAPSSPLAPAAGFPTCSSSCSAAAAEPETRTCMAFGDPHYANFARQVFDFFGRGLFEHARFDISSCGCEVVVQALLAKLTKGKVRTRASGP